MGDIFGIEGGGSPAGRSAILRVEALCASPVQRVELFNGSERVFTYLPYRAEDLGSRIRVLWEGAEYRGRGRETCWDGSAVIRDNRVRQARGINFWNPEKSLTLEGTDTIRWQSLTTGGFSGFDMILEHPRNGVIRVETPLLSFDLEVEKIGVQDAVMEAGGLGRRMRVFRLPDELVETAVSFERAIPLSSSRDNPLYAKVVQEDGHAAWSSPIYFVTG